MKTLLLLRHAKSSRDDPSLDDHDRPLAKRGKRASRKIGRLLDREDLWPERILCSTATRAASTLRRALKTSAQREEYADSVEFHRALYTFDAGRLADLVRELGGPEASLMVVGHNPAFENLLGFLAGEYRRFPTAALARVRLKIDRWEELDAGRGSLAGLWLPRELE